MATYESSIHPATLIGTFAQRPSAITVQKQGVTYFATDTFETYLSVIVAGVMTWQLEASGGPFQGALSHTLYVDGSTTTPTSLQDGSDERPYKTIMAAVAAMTAGTIILVTPGVYPENIVWRDLENTSISGLGATSTIVAPPTGDVFSWTPAVGTSIQNFNIGNITLVAAGAADRCILFDGTNTATFLTSIGMATSVRIFHPGGGDAVVARRVGTFRILNCVNFAGGNTLIANVSQGIIEGYIATGAPTIVSWDDTQPTPAAGRVNVIFIHGTVVGQLVMDKSPIVIVTRDVNILISLIDSGLVFDAGTGNAPILDFNGTIGLFGLIGGGGITLAYPTVPGGQSVLMLDKADISGAVTLTVAAGPRLSASARDVIWRETNPGTVSIGDLIDFDIRGSSYKNQAMFTAIGTATLDRDDWGIFGQADFAVAALFPIVPPFPAGTTDYTVVANPTNPVAIAVAPGTKTNADFTATPSAATGVTDFTIVRTQAA